MVSEFRREMLVRIMKLLDLALLCGAFLAALAASSDAFSWTSFEQILVIRIAVSNLLLFAAFMLACSAVCSMCRFYDSHRLSEWSGRLREIVLAVTIITGLLAIMRNVFELKFATNAFLILFWCLNAVGLFGTREAIRLSLRLIRLRGRNLRNVIIVGEEPDATALAERVRHHVGLGYRVLRIIDAGEEAQWSRQD